MLSGGAPKLKSRVHIPVRRVRGWRCLQSRPACYRPAIIRYAAAPATTKFAAITGGCLVMNPYASQVIAPAACTASSQDGRTRYEQANTAVASQPTHSDKAARHALGGARFVRLGGPERQQVGADLVPLLDQEPPGLEDRVYLSRIPP